MKNERSWISSKNTIGWERRKEVRARFDDRWRLSELPFGRNGTFEKVWGKKNSEFADRTPALDLTWRKTTFQVDFGRRSTCLLSLSLSLSFTLSALSMHRSTVAGRRRKKLGLAPMTSEQAQPVIKIGTQRPLEIMLNDSNLFRAFEIKFDEMEKTNFARQITFSFVTATTVAAERRHEQELTRDNDEILCTLNAISKLFLNLHYIFDFMVSIGKSCFNLIWIRFENKKIIWLKSDISAVPRIHEPWKLIKRAMTTTTTMCLATN